MGGLSGGERNQPAGGPGCAGTRSSLPGKRKTPSACCLSWAQQAVEEVNRYLGPEGLRESGSTLVMALLRQGSLTFLSVGDSRVPCTGGAP